LELWASIANSAPYSTYEDMTIHGNAVLWNVNTCWIGTNRLTVSNLGLFGNQSADPDGIEILSNTVSANLFCFQNSYVWDSSEADFGQPGLFPRTAHPNTVGGKRFGQCVLSSPTSPGGPLGPGPF
jgi:hypothetical protein